MFKIQIKGITIETEDASAVLHLIDAYGVKDSAAPVVGKITNDKPQPKQVAKKSGPGMKPKVGGTRDLVLSAIASSGKNAADISDEIKVNTTTVYAMLAYLKNQGLVIKNPDGTWSKKR